MEEWVVRNGYWLLAILFAIWVASGVLMFMYSGGCE